MASAVLMVGTRKGLWLGRSDDRRAWDWDGPHCAMEEVYSCLVDTRDRVPRLLAGSSSMWLGPQVRFSDDLGESWQETPVRFPADAGASVEQVWQLVTGPGRDGDDGRVVWAGTQPGAVFRSDDRGESFALVRGLWDHPHRQDWAAGLGGQAFHTVLPHPEDPESVTAALSTGGVYQTADGGESWQPRNTGIRAEFLPRGEQYPEFGQCVHKVTRHPAHPDRFYLQNHGGVYRSDDHGASWVSIADGLPSDFGFPVVVHPQRPETAYVFPLGGGDGRFPPEGLARVWRTEDAGDTWQELGDGLPDGFWVAVMRDAMCADDHDETGLYFGARDGSVWSSLDAGESWSEIASGLPDVMAVRAAMV